MEYDLAGLKALFDIPRFTLPIGVPQNGGEHFQCRRHLRITLFDPPSLQNGQGFLDESFRFRPLTLYGVEAG